MSPGYLNKHVIASMLALLEPRYTSPEAKAMLTAIALQESGLKARRQSGDGPARSYWQFEKGGIRGLLDHKASYPIMQALCASLNYPMELEAIHTAIEHNDILAAGCARALLFTHRDQLPTIHDPETAWRMYLDLWRPGQPRHETWANNWRIAWESLA